MDKTFKDPGAAVADVFDGAVIAFGGFFSAGRPSALTRALEGCSRPDGCRAAGWDGQ